MNELILKKFFKDLSALRLYISTNMFNVIFLIFFYFVYNKIYSLNLQRVGVFFLPGPVGSLAEL